MMVKQEERPLVSDYKLIDLLKFICAFLVIGIHIRPFRNSFGVLDLILYHDVANYAVPFFYACTGYFLFIKTSKENLHTKLVFNIKKVLKLYLIWSIIYLPLTMCGWVIEGGLNPTYLLLSLRNFIFWGENYYSWALWYLNGLIVALFLINVLLKRLSIKQIVGIGAILYFVGIELAVLNDLIYVLPPFWTKLADLYFTIFASARNGLFQSLVFVSLGMLIAEKECSNDIKPSVRKGLFIGVIYIIKIYFSLKKEYIYLSKMLDLPIFYYLFQLIIFACKRVNLKGTFYKQLRGMSKTIYFVHMYFVAFCSLVLYKGYYQNFSSFLICAVGSTIIALAYQYKTRKYDMIKKQ